MLQIRHDIYPARGRKQSEPVATSRRKPIRHDIYPARGRKPTVPDWTSQITTRLIRHDIYPARGRKHFFFAK